MYQACTLVVNSYLSGTLVIFQAVFMNFACSTIFDIVSVLLYKSLVHAVSMLQSNVSWYLYKSVDISIHLLISLYIWYCIFMLLCRSLVQAVSMIQNNARDLGELQKKVDSWHNMGLDEREIAIRSKDEQLKSKLYSIYLFGGCLHVNLLTISWWNFHYLFVYIFFLNMF